MNDVTRTNHPLISPHPYIYKRKQVFAYERAGAIQSLLNCVRQIQGFRVRIITAIRVTDLTIKGVARKRKGDHTAETEAPSDLQEISYVICET